MKEICDMTQKELKELRREIDRLIWLDAASMTFVKKPRGITE